MSKTVTNYQPGARGINLADGTTFWVEPGVEVSLSAKDGKQFLQDGDSKREVKGDLPDFGRKADPDADAAAADRIEALTAENADLKQQVETLTAELKKATAAK